MTARKAARIWSSGVGEAMDSPAGRALQIALVVLGLAGLALLAARRRWWELSALALRSCWSPPSVQSHWPPPAATRS